MTDNKQIEKKPKWLGNGRRKIINIFECELARSSKDSDGNPVFTFYDVFPSEYVIISFNLSSGLIEIEEPPIGIEGG